MSWLLIILWTILSIPALFYLNRRLGLYLRRRAMIVSIVGMKTDQILKLSPRFGVKQGGSMSDQLRRRFHGRMSSIPSVTVDKQEKTVELLWDVWGKRKVLNFSEISGLKVSMDRVDREIRPETVSYAIYKVALVLSDIDSITIAQEAGRRAAESLAAEIAQFLGLETVDKSL